MSQIDKLLNKICNLSDDVRFQELCKVMEHYEYQVIPPTGGGSHYKFVKSGHETIVIPKHGSVKRVYIEKIKQIIEEEEHHEDSK